MEAVICEDCWLSNVWICLRVSCITSQFENPSFETVNKRCLQSLKVWISNSELLLVRDLQEAFIMDCEH